MFDLTGKSALVTGASGGIGGAIARALHGQGAKVTLAGTRRAALDALAGELGTNAFVANILLFPNEAQPVEVQLRLHKGYPNPQGQVFAVDLQQSGAPNKPTQLIGGQRFRFDFNKLCLVPERAQWHYWDAGTFPGQTWPQLTYDDSQWKHGPAKLGFGDGNEATVIDGGPPGARHITTWFRNSFTLEDPTLYSNLWLRLKADDGAVVYLNGVEIARLRMPVGVAITPDTLASQQVGGLLR